MLKVKRQKMQLTCDLVIHISVINSPAAKAAHDVAIIHSYCHMWLTNWNTIPSKIPNVCSSASHALVFVATKERTSQATSNKSVLLRMDVIKM